jgi:hypothetical protein
MIRKLAVAALLSAAYISGAQAASTYVTNGGAGGVEATIDDAGNFDSSAAIGLRYKGVEFVNIDIRSSWYWFEAGGSKIAQYGSNPLGASTSSVGGGTAATTFSFGGWTFSQLVTAIAPNALSVHLNLTNNTGAAVTGVQWGVGLDPDPDGSGHNTTMNTIMGVGGASAVKATGALNGYSVTLSNTTGAGAYAISPFINVGDCCSAVNPATALGAGQAAGFSHLGDDSISLAYDIGTVGAGQTVALGYVYTFAVPEPETYALMLAGLASIGFITRRRRGG